MLKNCHIITDKPHGFLLSHFTFSISLRKRTAFSPYKTGVSPNGLAIIFSIRII